jgi:protoporphyrinogen oxidase
VAKIVILGAGLSGLSTSFHLERNGVLDYKLFEKSSTPGGLCRSVHQDGFTFDYTGHLLHVSDPYFKDFLTNIIGLHNFNLIERRSFVYSHDTYTAYPFQTNLYGLPTKVIAECIEGFIKRNTSRRTPRTMHEWTLKHFGAGIGKHFLFPYNKKLWCLDAHEQHPSWTQRFVPTTSLEAMIEGAIKPRAIDGRGYNSNFYYPKQGGIASFSNDVAKTLTKPIHYEYEAKNINLKERSVTFTNGHKEFYEQLVSTLPLNTFLKMLTEPAHLNLARSAPKLRCNSVVNFNLGLSIPDLSEKHWIYFPELKYAFYRVGFWNNFASSMAKKGCSSLYGEFSYVATNKSPQAVHALTQRSIKQILHVLGITKNDIVTQKILNLEHAYVMYDTWREKNLPKILEGLKNEQIQSIGRYGAWKYSSMQDAILDGKEAAEKLLAVKKTFIAAPKTTLIQPTGTHTRYIKPAKKDSTVKQ